VNADVIYPSTRLVHRPLGWAVGAAVPVEKGRGIHTELASLRTMSEVYPLSCILEVMPYLAEVEQHSLPGLPGIHDHTAGRRGWEPSHMAVEEPIRMLCPA